MVSKKDKGKAKSAPNSPKSPKTPPPPKEDRKDKKAKKDEGAAPVPISIPESESVKATPPRDRAA